jgi:hypothetical protein
MSTIYTAPPSKNDLDEPPSFRSTGISAELEAASPETRSHQLRSNASCTRTGMNSHPSYLATASRICAVWSFIWCRFKRTGKRIWRNVDPPQERRQTSLRNRRGSSSRPCSCEDAPSRPLARRSPRSHSIFDVRGQVGRRSRYHQRMPRADHQMA